MKLQLLRMLTRLDSLKTRKIFDVDNYISPLVENSENLNRAQ